MSRAASILDGTVSESPHDVVLIHVHNGLTVTV